MADGDGADGLGLFDPLPLPDNFDGVLHWLDIPDLDNAEPVPPPAAPVAVHSVLEDPWPAMLDNYSIGNGGAPGAIQPRPTGLPVHDGPSTSAAAAARQAVLLDCGGCQVLREVVHSNGLEVTKLFIHGGAGVFYHATLDIYRINSEGLAPALTHQSSIEFRGRDYHWVKHYLTDYALRRAAGNFAVVHDSLSPFHDVLCTTMNHGSHVGDAQEGAAARNGGDQLVVASDAAGVVQPPIQRNIQPAAGPSQPSNTTDVQQHIQPVGRSALALQRERTGRLQFQDIAPYFHLPIKEAARKIDICTTVLKGVCRRVGLRRWPRHKVKKIDRQIGKLRRSGNGAWARNEIERLSADRRRIFYGLE